jgi:RNA-directed DNA polymerase
MLTALEDGVKGGRWFSVIDKVYARANLESAFQEVKNNGGAAGVDYQTVAKFDKSAVDLIFSVIISSEVIAGRARKA